MFEPRELKTTEYTVEIWDWKQNKYIADVSHILTTGIRMDWVLNDVETIEFGLDFEQFKIKCKDMGVTPQEVLTPYIHDIRVRRNGKYIIGAQVVQLDFNINNESAHTIQVKCTGFLNVFKDDYINAQYAKLTYSEIAQRLVIDSQKEKNLTKNPSGTLNSNYWVMNLGLMQRYYRDDIKDWVVEVKSNNGAGAIGATQVFIPKGVPVDITFNLAANSNDTLVYIYERSTPSNSATQNFIAKPSHQSWAMKKFTFKNVVFQFDNPWILFEAWGPQGYFLINDLRVTRVDERDIQRKGCSIGVNTAKNTQSSSRQRGYELQNVKDAIVNLTKLQDDNFDFEFKPNREFNVYARKGADKPDIEVVYPGNLYSMSITRSAAELFNKVTGIGSGIGDERIERTVYDQESIRKYGVREKVETFNNVSIGATLLSHSNGTLYQKKDLFELPSVVIKDGSINPSNVEVGDSIIVRVENEPYLENISDLYRVIGMSCDVGMENQESVTLALERPLPARKPFTIRYIKDTMTGSTANEGNHWVQIMATINVGGQDVNIASGKTVIVTGANSNQNRIVDGNTASNHYYDGGAGTQSVTIDLGQEYPIEHIKVWHYWADGRRYRNTVLSVGSVPKPGNQPLDHILWHTANYAESSEGRTSRNLQELKK